MFEPLHPTTPEELRDQLADAGRANRSVEVFGANSKHLMGGPRAPASVQISTTHLNRIIQYEPRDLTVSVQAGMRFADLSRELARHGQMIPLDGPWSSEATVGGMIAANISGSRRRLYGTARDLVIGMQFATLDGKLVQSGGMVVKNVAGLDMAKLLIGSFGTLAAITSVNFKLTPVPPVARTLLFRFPDAKSAVEARNAALQGVLTPVAVDILNPRLCAHLQLPETNFLLALQFAGNQEVIGRSTREAEKLGVARALAGAGEQEFWNAIQTMTPRHLETCKDGCVVRVSTTLADVGAVFASTEVPCHSHAASGVTRAWFPGPDEARLFLLACVKNGWKSLVEYSGESAKRGLTLWPEPGSDFAIMKRIKDMFDPAGLLNNGRLYGRL